MHVLRKTRRELWTAGRVINAVRHRPLLIRFVVVFLLAGGLLTGVGTAIGLLSFRDVGYPDSATLLRIGDFVHSGYIYPDIDRPPYLVTLYGPLSYVLLGIPYRLAEAAAIAPRVAVRLGIVGALILCVLLVFLISRRLYSSRPISWLCALFAVSAFPMISWTTQIRGDFLALGFSLLSIHVFLHANARPQVIVAAICSGIAFLVKQTALAVLVAVISWLIYKRRYKEAVCWAMGFALTVVGGYGIAWWREPLLLKHLAALSDPVLDYRGALNIIWAALPQPAVPFAAIGGLLALRERAPEKLFFVIYCVAAWLVAMLTIPQAGGNLNYFWEPLFASAVLAGPGLYELQREVYRAPILVTVLLFVLLLRSFLPVLRQDLAYIRQSYGVMSVYQVHKTKWESFVSIVSGRRLLSTMPDVTSHSMIPELPDPYLNSALELRGRWNSSPVVAQIDAGVYDLIVVREGDEAYDRSGGYRGVPTWSEGMWKALRRTYRPACLFENMEVWLPRRDSAEILPSLSAIGCLAGEKRYQN
jgi:hypothetical protein